MRPLLLLVSAVMIGIALWRAVAKALKAHVGESFAELEELYAQPARRHTDASR